MKRLISPNLSSILGFAKGKGKGHWSVPLKQLADPSERESDKLIADLPTTTVVKDELKDDEPSNVPGDEPGESSESRKPKCWIYVFAQNEWIAGDYDTRHAPKVRVNKRKGGWCFVPQPPIPTSYPKPTYRYDVAHNEATTEGRRLDGVEKKSAKRRCFKNFSCKKVSREDPKKIAFKGGGIFKKKGS